MSERLRLELPDTLVRSARAVATQTNRRLEEVLLEWLDRAAAEIPVDQLPDDQVLTLRDLQMAETTVSPILMDHALKGPPQGHWTVNHWEHLPKDGNRYEIIEGKLYMTTSPSTFHQWIVGRWIRHIGIAAEDRGLGTWYTAPIGVLLAPKDAAQPDFLFIRADRVAELVRDRRVRGAPDLVVEVLSPGNSTEEMANKRTMYARGGVAEYVEVDPATRRLLHYQLENGTYDEPAVYAEDQTISLMCLPDLPLRVAALFAGAPDTTL
jgi:Uma2 family endonuclease